MKNILAENMLRFGTKNVSEADIKKRLTEATLKELDPLMANATKYFAAEFRNNTSGPQFATANLIYVAQPSNMQSASRYIIEVYKAQSASFGVTSFIIPVLMGLVDYDLNYGLTDGGDLKVSLALDMLGEPDLKSAAAQINEFWNSIDAQVAMTHLNGRKAKLSTSIASIKTSTNFAALGPMLTGTAKSVYDMIAV